ncbi:porin [Paracoccaceae bacterium GXU_MW_L88]
MKNVLFATTALVAFAGAAAAQDAETGISLTGSAELGVSHTSLDGLSGPFSIEGADIGEGNDSTTHYVHDFDLKAVATGTTNNGLTFGGEMDLDDLGRDTSYTIGVDEEGNPVLVEEAGGTYDYSVYISGAFGTLTGGSDVDSAFEKALAEIATGGIDDEAAYYDDEHDLFNSNFGGDTLRYDYSIAGFTLSGSYQGEAEGLDNGLFSVGAGFSRNVMNADLDFGLAYQTGENDDNVEFDAYGITAGTTYMGFGLTAGYTRYDIDDEKNLTTIQGSATYAMDAYEFGANVVSFDFEDEAGLDWMAYGLFGAYNLGGGAKATAAVSFVNFENELDGDAAVDYDVTRIGGGIEMEF